jgi:hypothetical protein
MIDQVQCSPVVSCGGAIRRWRMNAAPGCVCGSKVQVVGAFLVVAMLVAGIPNALQYWCRGFLMHWSIGVGDFVCVQHQLLSRGGASRKAGPHVFTWLTCPLCRGCVACRCPPVEHRLPLPVPLLAVQSSTPCTRGLALREYYGLITDAETC